MKQYLDLLRDVLENGEMRNDRTGTGTLSVFGRQLRFDLRDGFPLLTTKKVNFKAIVAELLWFLSGSTNIKYLNDCGVHIWDAWADKDGNLGPIYGQLWRRWPYYKVHHTPMNGDFDYKYIEIDQIKNVIESIKKDPFSRRHIISTWHPGELENQRLPCCHGIVIQLDVSASGKLSCSFYCRSQDFFIGTSFNLASYALLTHMMAQVCNLEVGDLIWSAGSVHLYLNHIEQVKLQLTREARALPKLILNSEIKNIDDFKFEDIKLEGYAPHPVIKAPISV